jgi:hypothetical protein
VVYGRLSPAGKRMATPWAQPHLANEGEREKNDKERSEWMVEQDAHACSGEETHDKRPQGWRPAGYDSSPIKASTMALVIWSQPAIRHSAMQRVRPEEPIRLCIRAAEVSAPNWR